MAIRRAVTEIPDSEDEPLTSSPSQALDGCNDAPSPNAQTASHEDARQHQALSQGASHPANESLDARQVQNSLIMKLSDTLEIADQHANTHSQRAGGVQDSQKCDSQRVDSTVAPISTQPDQDDDIDAQQISSFEAETNRSAYFASLPTEATSPGTELDRRTAETVTQKVLADTSDIARPSRCSSFEQYKENESEQLPVLTSTGPLLADPRLEESSYTHKKPSALSPKIHTHISQESEASLPDISVAVTTTEPAITVQASKLSEVSSFQLDSQTKSTSSFPTEQEMPQNGQQDNPAIDSEASMSTQEQRLTPFISTEPQDRGHTPSNQDTANTTNSLPTPVPSAPQYCAPTPPKPPKPPNTQESTLATLKSHRASLLASLAALPQIQSLVALAEHPPSSSSSSLADDANSTNGTPTDAQVTAAANQLVRTHIRLLHEYNEIKDVAQGLMGLIAEQRGVRVVEVMEEFGVGGGD